MTKNYCIESLSIKCECYGESMRHCLNKRASIIEYASSFAAFLYLRFVPKVLESPSLLALLIMVRLLAESVTKAKP